MLLSWIKNFSHLFCVYMCVYKCDLYIGFRLKSDKLFQHVDSKFVSKQWVQKWLGRDAFNKKKKKEKKLLGL